MGGKTEEKIEGFSECNFCFLKITEPEMLLTYFIVTGSHLLELVEHHTLYALTGLLHDSW